MKFRVDDQGVGFSGVKVMSEKGKLKVIWKEFVSSFQEGHSVYTICRNIKCEKHFKWTTGPQLYCGDCLKLIPLT